jgi:hypothetical protein
MRRRSSIVRTVLQAMALATAPLACSEAPAAGGPPAATTTELRGAFRSPDTPESLQIWTGPNDTQGWERLTKLVAAIDGQTVHSMAASTIRLAGVCRAPATGLDQVLLSFNRAPHGKGGAGALLYDAGRQRFTVEFVLEDITQHPRDHFDCPFGQSLLPESPSATPCLCPWEDSPLGRKRPVRHGRPASGG